MRGRLSGPIFEGYPDIERVQMSRLIFEIPTDYLLIIRKTRRVIQKPKYENRFLNLDF